MADVAGRWRLMWISEKRKENDMNFKRILIILCLFCMFPLMCIAENKQDRIFYAMDSFQNWMDVLQEKQLSVQDENSLYITEQYLDTMLFMKSVLLNSNMAKAQEGSQLPVFSWNETEDENDKLVTLQTDACRMTSGNKYACQAVYSDEYYQMILYSYGQDDQLMSEDRIELARKDDEVMVAFLSYNGQMDIVSRFATWYHDADAETEYTQVFGSEMDIVLKPKDWCEGTQTISDFNKDLLLPAQNGSM